MDEKHEIQKNAVTYNYRIFKKKRSEIIWRKL